MKKRLITATIIALAVLLGVTVPAFAMDEPDSVSLDNIEVFKDQITTGDFLAVVPYHIPFTTQPDDNIDETVTFRVMSANGTTEYGSVTAYPKYDGGYGDGIVTFYIESGMVWEESYIFRVQQNPAFYPSPKNWDFVIDAANYSTDPDQEWALRVKILDVANELSVSFGVELLSTAESGQTVLSTYGELYFIRAIPGLQTMCPKLFGTQIRTPSYTKRSWTTVLADALKTKYAGTFIADFMTGYAGLFSMGESSAMNFLSIIGFVALIFLSVWKFKATTLSGFVDGYTLLLLLMLNGFWSMILNGLFAFLSVVVGGVILFLNKS